MSLSPLQFWRLFTWRHWRRAPGTHLLLVLLLGTGVAAFLGIRLANRSALTGFQQFTQTLGSGAPLTLESTAGPFPARHLFPIREAFDLHSVDLLPGLLASGFHEERASPLRLLGLDLVAARNVSLRLPEAAELFNAANAADGLFQDALRGDPMLLLTAAAARSLGVTAGDTLPLTTDAGRFDWWVGAVLPEGLDAPGIDAFADIRTLQVRAGRPETIDRVEVFPLRPLSEAQLDAVRRRLPPGLLLSTDGGRSRTANTLSAAFRMNLSALSLLALVVSLYLILQALDAAVVRRRSEIAVLRSLGVPGRAIRNAWFREALSLGIVGSLAGVLLGLLLARFSVGAVTGTMENLYLQGSTRGALWSTSEVLLALLLGITASLLAGWLPARDAALTPPAQSLGKEARHLPIQLLDHPAYGALALIMTLIFIALPPLKLPGGTRFPLGGYLAAFSLAVGISILACLLPPRIASLLQRLQPNRLRLRLAASHLRRLSGRHKLALAGLIMATAMAGGITLLVHSFEHTITRWLGDQLEADLFVSARGFQHPGSDARIPADLRDTLLRHPAVRDGEYALMHRIQHRGHPIVLTGIQASDQGGERIWIHRPAGGLDVLREPTPALPLLASEPFVRRFRHRVGDEIRLQLPSGEVRGILRGVFADYANEHGTLVMHAATLAELLGEDRTATLGLFLHPEADPGLVLAELQAAHPSLNLRDQQSLRKEIYSIFRQTFSVTAALKLIGLIVAIAGLLLSQISLFLERGTERKTLRALGFTPRDLQLSGAWESGILAAIGGLTGLTAALGLGGILIFIINRQAFGWTLQPAVPLGAFTLFWLALTLTGAAAGLFAGRLAATLPIETEE